MNAYIYGYWYVCDGLLSPVARWLWWRGEQATYRNAWLGDDDLRSWETWINSDAPGRVFLSACDINTHAHAPVVLRVRQCQRAGIPTVSVMHGIPPKPLGAASDIVCLWGEAYRDRFPNNETRVTGNPALDNVPSREHAQYVMAQIGVPLPYALFTGSLRNQYTNPGLFADAIRAVAGRMTVIVSPHPNPAEMHHVSFFEQLARECPGVRLWTEGPSWLRTLVSGADLVFGRSSVLVEAAAQGVPALAVRDLADPHVDGVVYHQWDGPASVGRALAGQPSAEFARRHLYALSGAGERVVRVLEQTATGRLPQEVVRAIV